MDVRLPGYVPRPSDILAIRSMLNRHGGVRALLIEGPPGVGKTFLGQSFAQGISAQVLYYLCHNWSTEEELFLSVDIGRVVVGIDNPDDVYKPGVLLRAVQLSLRGPIVLIIDEIDKAPQKVEALLLDFLQTGRVHGPKGEVYQADVNNLYVILTTNGSRSLMEATLRRMFRLRMSYLPEEAERDLLRKMTGAPANVIKTVVAFANIIRQNGSTSPSVQEIKNLLIDLTLAKSVSDITTLIDGWLIKEEEDRDALESIGDYASILWGEMKRGGK